MADWNRVRPERRHEGTGVLALLLFFAAACAGCDHFESRYLIVTGSMPALGGSEVQVTWWNSLDESKGDLTAESGRDGVWIPADLVGPVRKAASGGADDWYGPVEAREPRLRNRDLKLDGAGTLPVGSAGSLEACLVRSRAAGVWDRDSATREDHVSPHGLEVRGAGRSYLCIVPRGAREGVVWVTESTGPAKQPAERRAVGVVRRAVHLKWGDEWVIELKE